MKPTTVTIRTEQFGLIEVDAWDFGIPGLVINRITVERTGEPCWVITHQLSGNQIGLGLGSPEAAVAALYRLALLADWTRSAYELRDQPGLSRAAVGVLLDLGADVVGAPFRSGEPVAS